MHHDIFILIVKKSVSKWLPELYAMNDNYSNLSGPWRASRRVCHPT
jgi:hypothetical protein